MLKNRKCFDVCLTDHRHDQLEVGIGTVHRDVSSKAGLHTAETQREERFYEKNARCTAAVR